MCFHVSCALGGGRAQVHEKSKAFVERQEPKRIQSRRTEEDRVGEYVPNRARFTVVERAAVVFGWVYSPIGGAWHEA